MKNVLGTDLKLCSKSPLTGYFRDGFCRTDSRDLGRHVVACVMTDEFLEFSKLQGNDLSTPNLVYGFPGLKKNDRWCVCATRWKEAFDAGFAPPVVLEATHEKALEFIKLDCLITMSASDEELI